MEKEKLIHLAVKCLKALFIILCVAIALIIIYIAKEIKLVKIIQYIIGILSPVFCGFLIAWLFDPLVGFLTKKKISICCNYNSIFAYYSFLCIHNKYFLTCFI